MIGLLLSGISLLVALVLLLPTLLPAPFFVKIPFSNYIGSATNFLFKYGVNTFIDASVAPYVIPSLFVVVALLFLITYKKFFLRWLVLYTFVFYYTTYLFLQLLYKEPLNIPALKVLEKQPFMAMVLLVLVFLLELLLWFVSLLISLKLEKLRKGRIKNRTRENVKVETPKKRKAKVEKPKKEKKEKKDKKEESSVIEEDDSFLPYFEVKESVKLKTIAPTVEDEVYVGSVKIKDENSLYLKEESLKKEAFDPIDKLKKQMAQEAQLFVHEKKRVEPKAVVIEEKAIEIKEVPPLPVLPKVEEELVEQDVEQISGIGGLVSSNEGIDALLSRNKIDYSYPPEMLLDTYPDHVTSIDQKTQAAGEDLIATLKQFKIEATLKNIVKGPTVTMFEVTPAPGIRVSSILSLSDNIALQLAARQVRIVAPIPGKQAVGIEVPNKERSIIGFKDLLPTIDEKQYQVPMILGRKITGEPVVIELTQTPHLLIAGATGSGKSVCVNSLISSILYRRSPKEVRLILVDPKIVELRVYNGIPHLLTPVITEPKKTIKALEFCLYEMERRYKMLNALAVRNISAYNRKIKETKLAREKLPYIVVIIDEFADLMTTVGKELETLLARLAAMARAVGIHLVLATQRPSANVITGIIKSNIPTRIAFMVASQIDSRIIIDETGAEKLLGRGDMLFAPGWDPNSVRIQGAFLSDDEVERIVEYAKSQGEPDYLDESFFEEEESDVGDDDDESINDTSDEALMEKALKIVVERQGASASYLQRRLKIGYNRAARLVEQMEEDGLVGPSRGSKPRELLRLPD